MKRRIIVVLITTAVSMALFTYFQARSGQLQIGARTGDLPEYSDPRKAIKIGVGREFIIVLESNPATGYSWQLAQALDKNVLKVVEIKHSAKKTNLIGAGGKDLWTLQGLQPAETQITFEYARSWEKDIPPVKRSIFTIRIQK